MSISVMQFARDVISFLVENYSYSFRLSQETSNNRYQAGEKRQLTNHESFLSFDTHCLYSQGTGVMILCSNNQRLHNQRIRYFHVRLDPIIFRPLTKDCSGQAIYGATIHIIQRLAAIETARCICNNTLPCPAADRHAAVKLRFSGNGHLLSDEPLAHLPHFVTYLK